MGGRTTKQHREAPQEPSAPPPPSDYDVAMGKLDATEVSLLAARKQLDNIVASGGAEPAHFRELGNVTRALNQLETERRAQRKLRDAQSQALTMEMVVGWLRQQTADKRAHVIREAAQMDAGGSVLA